MASKSKSRLSLKQLESELQDLEDFEKPKLQYEQYATPPHIGALMLNAIDTTYDDIRDKFIADLGCGTGRLSIGSILCGAGMVYGFDCDREALKQATENVADTFGHDEDNESEYYASLYRNCGNINFILADINDKDSFWTRFNRKFDTVIMNPPFGTKNNQGLDMLFLKRALDMTEGTVYSLHKTSTRKFILNKCQQWKAKAKPVAQIKYNLDNTYGFHKKKSVDIEVDLWRIKSPSIDRC